MHKEEDVPVFSYSTSVQIISRMFKDVVRSIVFEISIVAHKKMPCINGIGKGRNFGILDIIETTPPVTIYEPQRQRRTA